MRSWVDHFNVAYLWFLEAMSLGFVAAGVVILVVDPANWLPALASTIFFGMCAAMFAYQLLWRRRRVSR
jgi:hypothetical protein